MGSIVTYKNDQKLLEIIDGQQRITTLTLLFRAFYEHFKNEGKNVKQGYLNGFGRCIWKFDSADEKLYFDEMHLYSEVAIDDDKEIKSLDFLFLQFMHIIRAQHEDFDTTTQSVLNFFTKQDKKVYYGASENWLYKDETIPFILNLADFWLNPQDYLSRKSTNCLKNLNLFQNDA